MSPEPCMWKHLEMQLGLEQGFTLCHLMGCGFLRGLCSKEKFPYEEWRLHLPVGIRIALYKLLPPEKESKSLSSKILCASVTGKAQGPTSRNRPESLIPENFHGTRRHHAHFLRRGGASVLPGYDSYEPP